MRFLSFRFAVGIFLFILVNSYRYRYGTTGRSKSFMPSLRLGMALDKYLVQKLDNIQRTFEALTERLADPDVTSDRKQLLKVTKERASIEDTVVSYQQWKDLEKERQSVIDMEQFGDSDPELKEMARDELKQILGRQDELEEQITLMLLPKDPNDGRNVMLEVRAGAGGDEASIWAGELVNIYKKYADMQGWRVQGVSESVGEMGGFKTCVVQVTGDFVYSKLKYEVSPVRSILSVSTLLTSDLGHGI